MGASAVLKLQEVGFTAAQVRALADFMDTQAASKADLMEVKSELKEEISALKSELKGEISALRSEVKEEISALRSEVKGEIFALNGEIASLRSDMRLLERDLKIWFGRMMAWQLSAVAVIVGIATAAHKLL